MEGADLSDALMFPPRPPLLKKKYVNLKIERAKIHMNRNRCQSNFACIGFFQVFFFLFFSCLIYTCKFQASFVGCFYNPKIFDADLPRVLAQKCYFFFQVASDRFHNLERPTLDFRHETCHQIPLQSSQFSI